MSENGTLLGGNAAVIAAVPPLNQLAPAKLLILLEALEVTELAALLAALEAAELAADEAAELAAELAADDAAEELVLDDPEPPPQAARVVNAPRLPTT